MDLPGWQALRNELKPLGMEIVTVGLEMGGANVLRSYIDDAAPEHPSLVDQAHVMDSLFGVTNIPESIWIDERGMIVRVRDVAVPPPVMRPNEKGELEPYGMGGRYGFSIDADANRLRDWATKGADSEYVLSPDAVVATSQPRSMDASRAAAHFELAQHLWREQGFTEASLRHFAEAHTLQPDNITYKRQAYSAYRFERSDGDEFSRFNQTPGDNEPWPFVSNFTIDMANMRAQREAQSG
jgi:hypothetical protein